jgi:multicomponent Na+:H+ antiporter subunit B
MNLLILQAATRILKPLMILLSIFLLIRGHNEPGGGFSGGLMAAAAFCLNGIAFDPDSARRTLKFDPRRVMAAGLLLALASGFIGLLYGHPTFTGIWYELYLPGEEKIYLGTPLLFDVGVYLAVLGVVLTIFLGLLEETHGT